VFLLACVLYWLSVFARLGLGHVCSVFDCLRLARLIMLRLSLLALGCVFLLACVLYAVVCSVLALGMLLALFLKCADVLL
jgi:hypothetical protein